MHQLELLLDAPPRRPSPNREPTEAEIERFQLQLDQRLGGRLVDLSLTGNRSTILTAAPANGDRRHRGRDQKPLALRIHRSFVFAPTPVLDAVAAYAGHSLRRRSRGAALEIIRSYFEQATAAQPRGRHQPRLEPRGRYWDLSELRDALNRRYFNGELEAAITWGRRIPRGGCRRQRSVQLGSYAAEENLIRLHRVLDRQEVPRFVVESVVFHELLHVAIPAVRRGRRRILHPPEFRRREREFERLAEAEAWINRHLFRLLQRVGA